MPSRESATTVVTSASVEEFSEAQDPDTLIIGGYPSYQWQLRVDIGTAEGATPEAVIRTTLYLE